MSGPQASEASAGRAGLVSCSTMQTPNKAPNLEFDTTRTRITKMQRAVMKGANLHTEHALSILGKCRPIMATLTYRNDREPTAADVRDCITRARVWLDRKYRHLSKECRPKLRYVWTAELTKKGKLHYHILFFLPGGLRLPMFDRAGFWKHGMSRLEWARNGIAYIAKYASKGGGDSRQKFPKGFRLHGSGGFSGEQRIARRYHLAPAWVRNCFTFDEIPKRMKGGWISMVTGEIVESPYQLISASAGRVRLRVAQWYSDRFPSTSQELHPCLN